jgi:cobalt-zinc-cadmium resistance protein CzcA
MGAVVSYREGAIDYVTFLQHIRDAIQIEIDSWMAFGKYLDNRYQLDYYLKTSY